MNFHKIFFLLIFSFSIVSCGSDDDICTSGEGTPRMKVKFKATDGKIKTLDSLFVSVEYKDGEITHLQPNNSSSVFLNVDSVFVPLRVDENGFTNIYFRTSKIGDSSKLKVNYTTKTEYVSPACGMKKLYENLDASVENPNPILNVEINQTEILNEDKTHLYLIF